MHRTQIYLTEDDHSKLLHLSRSRQQSMADLVRTAVRRFLEEEAESGARDLLDRTFGAWTERKAESHEIVRALRQEWSSREERHGTTDRH